MSWPVLLATVAFSHRRRIGLRERLGFVPRRGEDRPCLWLHGVSVGEIKNARKLLEIFLEERPGWDAWITSTTPTGHGLACRLFPSRAVHFFPLDFLGAPRRALCRVRPNLVLLMELELWPRFLTRCVEQGVPVLVVNGRLSKRSFRGYRRFRALLGPIIGSVARFGVQNEEYGTRLRALGIPEERIHVTGNMKFDNVGRDVGAEANEEVRRRLAIPPGTPVLVAGSTHEGEESILLDVAEELRRRGKPIELILAPRHVERASGLGDELARRGWRSILWSRTPGGAGAGIGEEDAGEDSPRVCLVDTIGDLERIYAAAEMVFVGGSLIPHGGQNMLEPAAHAKPVVFGPHTANFREEAALLLEAGGARRVGDARDLLEVVLEFRDHPEEARRIGRLARRALRSRGGATRKNLELLAPWIEEFPSGTSPAVDLASGPAASGA